MDAIKRVGNILKKPCKIRFARLFFLMLMGFYTEGVIPKVHLYAV